MRVKLSYSVEEKDVLAEAAKMLNLCSDELQKVIQLFQSAQQELGKTGDDSPNVQTVLGELDDLRKCLLSVDTRAGEVSSVVSSYDDYRRESRAAPDEDTLESGQDDNFGSD